MKHSYSVKDFMARSLITFTPDMSVFKAMSLLVENKISGGPVIDTDGNLIGVVSEVDFHRTLMESSYYSQPDALVADVMSKNVVTIDINMGIHELAEKFLTDKFRRYPVMEDEQLVGQISRRDVLVAILKLRSAGKLSRDIDS